MTYAILRIMAIVMLAVMGWVALTIAFMSGVLGACEPYPITEHSPTGVVGCTVYGEGVASHWGGPGVARNDCIWPWTDCQPIIVTSLDTGLSVAVTPRMFCDCYTGTADQRIVDLDPATLAQLGLDPSAGLYSVRVEPIEAVALPNTAMDR